ncbi:serine hydrolase domain-containing protein [Aliikangiella coralliicola]|uniref:Serine hydrolase n=1 Tax=Aliikangiella coralliicola TaxID=2592383 RepID=A0A545U814_9GAMM|nr:serine hydrolase [Aliikangiella coralliicola]TQV85543.1 serine hydrolase [Aliikangiella coralliicola]
MKTTFRFATQIKYCLLGVLLCYAAKSQLTLSTPHNNSESDREIKLVAMEEKINKKEFKKITSVLVQHKGQLVYEKYFNSGGADTLNDIRSAGKSLTAILFGIALADKAIPSVDSAILPYFQDKKPFAHPFPAKSAISFKDLLTMSSSLECNDWEQYSAGNEERMYLRKDWEQFVLDLPERGIPPWQPKLEQRKYGRSYSYCTGGVFLIGSAIERTTGKKLDQYAQEKLFNPMGIKQVKWPVSPMGIIQGGGGVQFRSRDLIKIGQLMLNNGQFNKKQLVKENWVDEMLRRRNVAVADRNIEYGYLWWIFDFEVQNKKITAYAASGNGGNYLFIVPELHLTALVTSQAYNTSYMHQQSQSIFKDSILPSILN